MTPKINVVLEGGYNLDEIPSSVHSLIKILKGDPFPNETTEKKLTFYYFK